MKYAVIQAVNGAFAIVSEGNDEEKAIMNFHVVCSNLWNSADVKSATVEVVNEKMNVLKVEYIEHNTQTV